MRTSQHARGEPGWWVRRMGTSQRSWSHPAAQVWLLRTCSAPSWGVNTPSSWFGRLWLGATLAFLVYFCWYYGWTLRNVDTSQAGEELAHGGTSEGAVYPDKFWAYVSPNYYKWCCSHFPRWLISPQSPEWSGFWSKQELSVSMQALELGTSLWKIAVPFWILIFLLGGSI